MSTAKLFSIVLQETGEVLGRHYYKEDAIRSAKSLAPKYPGKRIEVTELIAAFEAVAPVEEVQVNVIPPVRDEP